MKKPVPLGSCLLVILFASFHITSHAQILDRIFLRTSETPRLKVNSWSWDYQVLQSRTTAEQTRAIPGTLVITRVSDINSPVLLHAFNTRTVMPSVSLSRGELRMNLVGAVIVGYEVNTVLKPNGKIRTEETISFEGREVTYIVNESAVCIDAESSDGCKGVLN